MNKLLPYETIVKAHEGDPDAIDTILSPTPDISATVPKYTGKSTPRLRNM